MTPIFTQIAGRCQETGVSCIGKQLRRTVGALKTEGFQGAKRQFGVKSEEGKGSTFSIRLPKAKG